VQRIAEVDPFVGVEVEPALAAGGGGARVPAEAQRLQPPVGHLDEVLLQRVDAERVGDAIVVHRAVGTVGADDEGAVLAQERRRHAVVPELAAVELASTVAGVAGCIARS
jgi:hypothetical protein